MKKRFVIFQPFIILTTIAIALVALTHEIFIDLSAYSKTKK